MEKEKNHKKEIIIQFKDSDIQNCFNPDNFSDWLRDDKLKVRLADCLNNKLFIH